MKAIILLSGGLDSAVAAAWAQQRWGNLCMALIFDYGQRHNKEIVKAKKLAEHFGWPSIMQKFSIPSTSALTGVGDVNTMIRGLPASFVPGRNMIFLSMAAAVAYTLEIEHIVGGWNIIDYSGYPDCRSDFLSSMEKTINLALGYGDYYKVRVERPLVLMNKKEIVLMGQELGVPFGMTWSCYEGGEKPCGVCGSCINRRKGFIEADIEDPLIGG